MAQSLQKYMIKLSDWNIHDLWICNVDAKIFDWIIDLSIWIKWTLQEYGKSNNAAQDGEQQPPHLNDEITDKKLNLCGKHLFRLK